MKTLFRSLVTFGAKVGFGNEHLTKEQVNGLRSETYASSLRPNTGRKWLTVAKKNKCFSNFQILRNEVTFRETS